MRYSCKSNGQLSGAKAMQQKERLCATIYVHMSKWMFSCSVVETVGTATVEELGPKLGMRR